MAHLDTPRDKRHLVLLYELIRDVVGGSTDNIRQFLTQTKQEALASPKTKVRAENLDKIIYIFAHRVRNEKIPDKWWGVPDDGTKLIFLRQFDAPRNKNAREQSWHDNFHI
jgi:hypothetical protein